MLPIDIAELLFELEPFVHAGLGKLATVRARVAHDRVGRRVWRVRLVPSRVDFRICDAARLLSASVECSLV